MRLTLLLVLLSSLLITGCSDQPTAPDSNLALIADESAALHVLEAHSSASRLERARNFRAHLNGGNQVLDVETLAQGQAVFQLNREGTELTYKVLVANIENAIGAHIHLAPAGENGPIVLPMLGNPFISDPIAQVNGVLVEGVATAADVSGPLEGDLEALVEAMRSGGTYVNVHTTQNRPGEIRGQIR